MKMSLTDLVLYGVAMAMGVAVIVTNILSPLSASNAVGMLGIGVAALGLAALRRGS
ncbi:MAG TPA: hypothetical protein PKE20_12155 [Promineifilum sp.]|nr:hypothetical protein [Promineifilum sp.]